MFTHSEILKKIRKEKSWTQQEMCRGIMARSTYAKIENGTLDITLENLSKLLTRVGYNISDYIKDVDNADSFKDYYKIYYKAYTSKATEKEIHELFSYVDATKLEDNRSLNLYGTTKFMLGPIYPQWIPQITTGDRALLKQQILKIVAPYAYYDLKTIADFAAIVLTPKEQKKLFKKMTFKDPYEYLDSKVDYTLQIFKVLNNFCDSAIELHDITWGKAILRKYKSYCNVFKELRYNYYFQVAEASIHYLETKNIALLEKLNDISVIFKNIGDDSTARAIQSQIVQLQKDNYRKEKHITRDK